MSLVETLSRLIGPAHVLTAEADVHRYAEGWTGKWHGRPLAVVRPADTAEVAAVLRACHAAGQPVVPQGGNSGLVDGGLPSAEGNEIVLSLERLNRVRAVDPIGFTMTVEAGCVLQTVIDRALAEDCFFPLSLGARGSCQIGGNVATNAGGINVLRWGMMRDLVLGLEVVLPDGRIWNGLSTLRKDNTGYDLKQLFIGAEGTLGIVTAASLKLFPRPSAVETCLLAVPSTTAALTLFGQARRGLCDLLSAYELLTRPCFDLVFETYPENRDPLSAPAPAYVLLETSVSGGLDLRPRLEAFLEAMMEEGLVLDGAVAESEAQRAAFWRIREDLVEAQYRVAPRHLRTDLSVPQAALAAFIAALDTMVAGEFPELRPIAYGHIGDGNVHYNLLPQPGTPEDTLAARLEACEARLFTITAAHRGSISAEHGIGRSKRAAFLETLPEVERDLMQGLKRLLDPQGLLSPGRVI
ncbi:FAD-binding oxidoreductase [Acidisoma sp. 7E03]